MPSLFRSDYCSRKNRRLLFNYSTNPLLNKKTTQLRYFFLVCELQQEENRFIKVWYDSSGSRRAMQCSSRDCMQKYSEATLSSSFTHHLVAQAKNLSRWKSVYCCLPQLLFSPASVYNRKICVSIRVLNLLLKNQKYKPLEKINAKKQGFFDSLSS